MQTLLAFSLGILPTIIWLGFWLGEDKKNPEPKRFIFLAFWAGMVSALVAQLAGDKIMELFFQEKEIVTLFVLLLLAGSEEIIKYLFAGFSVLRKSVNDEPIDAVIYMITVALGFSAMENTLYLWDIAGSDQLYKTIVVGNMRFIGATVLHTASSSIIGIMLALTFYKPKIIKFIASIFGLILAIALHTSFNFLIINDVEGNIFKVFMFIWIVILVLLLFFEKIKQIQAKQKLSNNKKKK
jgi:RsiW-degrading membrane proteinase PrsW (M82 family)